MQKLIMRLVKIKDIGKVVSGSTPSRVVPEYWNGNIPWITPREINQLKTPYLNKSNEKITELGFKSCSAKMLPKGTVIFSSRAPIGLVSVTNIEVCTNQGFKNIIPNKNIDSLYLYFVLKANTKKLNDLGTGTTFKELSKSAFENYKIPFPDTIEDQKKIGSFLSKAEALIQKRKETLELLDEFLKSKFLDMFGDPNINSKKFKKLKLKTFFELEPQNGLYKHGSVYGEGTKILRIDSFYDGIIRDLNKLKKVRLSNDEIEKYALKKNQIVINRVNSRDYLGKVGLIPEIMESIVFESNMMRFSVRENEINPIFLINLLTTSYIKNQILRCAKDASNQSSINQQDVKNLEIIVPPLRLQTRFAKIFEKLDGIKQRQEASLKDIENLYHSLMQRGFKGEFEKISNTKFNLLSNSIKHEKEAINLTSLPSGLDVEIDSGFVKEEEAKFVLDALQTDMISFLDSLPPINSKDKNLIKKIRDLDLQKKQAGKIDFDEDYAIYRVLYPKFEDGKPKPFSAIFEYVHDFKEMKYDITKLFIMNDLEKIDSRFEQVYNDELNQVELKLKL
jgi:type I restriction enzyme, S subunit